MPNTCLECGARTPEGGTCRDNLYALLLVESQIPGLDSPISHFRAVACYNLQHPESMGLTAEALLGLRHAQAEELDGRVTLEELRRRTRRAFNGSARVTRRVGDAEVEWPRGAWPMTVMDVLLVEPEADAYVERVLQWAQSVRETLDRAGDMTGN